MEYIIGFLLIGLLAGWLASMIVRGRGLGLIGDVMVGMIGALIGGLVFNALGIPAIGALGGLVTATIGAVLLLVIVNALQSGTGARHGPDL